MSRGFRPFAPMPLSRTVESLSRRAAMAATILRNTLARHKTNIALAFASVVVTLVMCEGLVRVYYLVRTKRELSRMARPIAEEVIDSGIGELGLGVRLSDRPNVVYELRPNLRGVYDGRRFRSDRYGFRQDGDVALEKPAGVVRIVGIGDSWMWGTGVDNGQTYLDRLREELTRWGLRAEVVNTGVWGYNARQEVATLRWKGLVFQPDIVVIGLCGNDRAYSSFTSERPFVELGRSFLWNEIATRWSHLLGAPREAVPEEGDVMPFSEFEGAYVELAALAKANHFSVVVFSECFGRGEPPAQHASCRLGTPGEWREFVSLLDRSGFRRCPWNIGEIPQNHPNYGHATVEGNRILGAKLAECVKPLVEAAVLGFGRDSR